MNTRFRPTPYQDLHCGSVLVAHANWSVARSVGAKFILQLDDYPYNCKQLGQSGLSLETCAEHYVEDLTWLGMAPDKVVWSIDNCEAHQEAADLLGIGRYRGGEYAIRRVNNPGVFVHYHPQNVLTAVVDDHLDGVGGFFRGFDLVGQCQLYDHLCRQLGWVPPCQEYLPIVRRETSRMKESKSEGSASIRELREAGHTAKGIIETLVYLCNRSYSVGNVTDVLIPEGVLTTASVKVLPFFLPLVKQQRKDMAGYYDESPVRTESLAHCARMAKRLKAGWAANQAESEKRAAKRRALLGGEGE